MGSLAAALCAAVLLVLSPGVMEAASQAAAVFAGGVMPALFPMMVLNGLAGKSRGMRHEAGKGRRYGAAVLLALLAGSPASAQRVAGDCREGLVEQRDLPALLAATGVMSPMFFLGTMAAQTGLREGCAVMLAAHWLAALAVGAALWGWEKRRPSGAAGPPPAEKTVAPSRPPSLWLALPGAVAAAAQAMLSICGAMMLFSIVACVVRALVAWAFPGFAAANGRAFAILWALLEIGGGAYAVLDAFPTPPLPLLCGLCSFGGLSICLQNLLFLGEKIRPGKLLWIRALHGAVACFICRLLLSLLFPFFL